MLDSFMKIYLVGGSVRDRILGRVPRDTDYLVTDSSEEELLANGFVKVGQSFPIFLDPRTGDEYTLSVSVETDLLRRDLTINAMALDEEEKLIDPFGGKSDLDKKILRHVARENFFADPLRIMRVARFQAQFPEFEISPETMELMQEVAETSAYQHLLSERIIKELRRVFESAVPSLFFRKLSEVRALRPYFPEGDLSSLDQAPKKEELQFSAFMTKLGIHELDRMKSTLNIQNDWYETARAWILYQAPKEDPGELLDFYYAIDAFRKPWLVAKLKELGGKNLESFDRVKDLGIRDIDQTIKGKAISHAIREKRLSALKKLFVRN
jgi:tRNA nucleotidyltransferase/poly(A) polymerase